MRATILSVFVLAWVSACVGCGTRPAVEAPRRELADRLELETVALVRFVNADGEDSEAGYLRVFCAGTWVGSREILTAGHCVEAAAGMSPIGAEIKFSQRGEYDPGGMSSYWTGHVVGHNHGFDLSLIRADVPPPGHLSAQVAAGRVYAGDRVEVVGHPGGHVWSYSEGYVAAWRPSERNADGDPMPTLQLQVPVIGGNSGGGAFDREGDLVGVCSYFERGFDADSFFVAREALVAFLEASR